MFASIIMLFSQRARLLDNTEKLERGSRRLQDGYRVIMETGILYFLNKMTYQ